MPLTVGTDSFVSIANADAYMATRLHASPWLNHALTQTQVDELFGVGQKTASDVNAENLDTKERALKSSTQLLNREPYSGAITSNTQALAWPRASIYDREGRALASNTIPADIENATAELALSLLQYDLTDERIRRSIFRTKSEGVGESFASYTNSSDDSLPAIVRQLIAPYQPAGEVASAPLVP